MQLPLIVGPSLGGLLAQRLAEMGRASSLVLLVSAPPEPLTSQEVTVPYFGPLVPASMDGLPFVAPNERLL
ncbi:MAG: hypothetical protein N2037_10935 [Acidimicrobiales bacterium]|nr:hypothetical protein [Acidimicrobiales bacterium]